MVSMTTTRYHHTEKAMEKKLKPHVYSHALNVNDNQKQYQNESHFPTFCVSYRYSNYFEFQLVHWIVCVLMLFANQSDWQK